MGGRGLWEGEAYGRARLPPSRTSDYRLSGRFALPRRDPLLRLWVPSLENLRGRKSSEIGTFSPGTIDRFLQPVTITLAT